MVSPTQHFCLQSHLAVNNKDAIETIPQMSPRPLANKSNLGNLSLSGYKNYLKTTFGSMSTLSSWPSLFIKLAQLLYSCVQRWYSPNIIDRCKGDGEPSVFVSGKD